MVLSRHCPKSNPIHTIFTSCAPFPLHFHSISISIWISTPLKGSNVYTIYIRTVTSVQLADWAVATGAGGRGGVQGGAAAHPSRSRMVASEDRERPGRGRGRCPGESRVGCGWRTLCPGPSTVNRGTVFRRAHCWMVGCLYGLVNV